MSSNNISIGLSKISKKEVGRADTLPSRNAGGILDFLVSTPAILQWIIEESSDMLDPLLPDGMITVGRKIELTHEKPTLVGENITLILTVFDKKGENIVLDISIHDSMGLISRGIYERSIVEKNHLLDVAYRRSTNLR